MAAQGSKQGKDKKDKGAGILKYSGLGLQVAVTIGAGSYFGSWLDEKYASTGNWFTLIGVLLSTALAMYYTIRTLNRYNDQ